MSRFKNWERPTIKHMVPTKWHWLVSYPEGLELSKNTDIGSFTFIQAQEGVVIEENVEIGSHCSIYSVSTIRIKRNILGTVTTRRPGKVVLKRGCMIGSHSIIMPGVTIGEGAVIGARSYIDKDIPKGAIIIPQQSFRAMM